MTSSFGAKYKVIQKIGEGSFSEVLKCEDRASGTLYAAKRLRKTFKTASDVMNCAEIIAMHKLSRHPNVLYMIEYFYDPSMGKLTYVFELLDMSMYEFMKMRKRAISEIKVKNYLYQMLKGLEHLHKNGLFHRDIKPENILVKLPQPHATGLMNEIVKLADLGSIRGIYSKPPYTEYISTRWYRSPECLLTVGYYGPKMDVWASGCVFYEMLTLKPLFPGSNEIDQLSKIHTILGTPSARLLNKLKKKSHNCQNFPRQLGSGISALIGQFSEDGQSILKLMVQYDPETRINVKRLVEHRYFASLREQYLINQFRFTALQQSYGVESFSKGKGDYVTNYLNITDKLRHTKYQNTSPRIYVHRQKKTSPIPSSKTSSELTTIPATISPNAANTSKHKKQSPMQFSKTLTDINNVTSNLTKPKKHLLRQGEGPLVTQKQFKEWGVSASMLKPPRGDSKHKDPPSKEKSNSNNSKTRTCHPKRHGHHSGNTSSNDSSSFRKTTSNLPVVFRKNVNESHDAKAAKQFQSKSFVLPRRVTAKFKLDTIKEYWQPNFRTDNKEKEVK